MTDSSVLRTSLVVPLAVLGLLACSGTTTTDPDAGSNLTPPPSNATVAITSPADGDQVTIDSTLTIPVEVEVTGFTLKEPGACGDEADCGHVELLVDGYECDAPDANYNAASASTSLLAQLSTCATSAGPHHLSVELHRDDGSVVVGPSGKYVSDAISVEASPPPPSLAITSPAAGSVVWLSGAAEPTVNVEFDAQNLTLVPSPGSCFGDPACGVLIVNVDGDACNDPDAPVPINNFGATTSPIGAKLALCPSVTGEHTVTLTVLDDSGAAPLMVEGAPLTAEVTFTALIAPTLTINSPAEGATVAMGGDGELEVPIDFTLTDLTLQPTPGNCGGDPACGEIAVNIDGNDCDNPNFGGAPFNNAGATSSPINALFAYCGVPAGNHTVTLTVLDDTGMAPYFVDGVPLTAEINITTE